MSVKRETYCNRCGVVGETTESGRWSTTTPVGWGLFDLEIEGPDPEPGHHREPEVEMVYDLCPTCAKAAVVFTRIFMAEPGNPDLVEVDLDTLP